MTPFNIDDYTPEYKSPWRMTKRQKATLAKDDLARIERSSWIHTSSYRWTNRDRSLGIKPSTILAWRKLESRVAQLWDRWAVANEKFWDSLKVAHKARGLERGQTLIVMVDEDDVICYEGMGGFSTSTASKIMEDLDRNSQSHGDFLLLKRAEGGEEIGRLRRRADRLHHAALAYDRALHRAIEDRIKIYIEKFRDSEDRYHYTPYYPPKVYLIENEGRTRVVMSDTQGRITWAEGEVLYSKEQK